MLNLRPGLRAFSGVAILVDHDQDAGERTPLGWRHIRDRVANNVPCDSAQ
jgi:hypothetical protein